MTPDEKKLSGWEREFWKLLSPESTRLLKAELAERASEQSPTSHVCDVDDDNKR